MSAMIKAKSLIVFILVTHLMAQTSTIIDDDDRTAKESWDALETLHTTSNAQSILNLHSEHGNLEFREEES